MLHITSCVFFSSSADRLVLHTRQSRYPFRSTLQTLRVQLPRGWHRDNDPPCKANQNCKVDMHSEATTRYCGIKSQRRCISTQPSRIRVTWTAEKLATRSIDQKLRILQKRDDQRYPLSGSKRDRGHSTRCRCVLFVGCSSAS